MPPDTKSSEGSWGFRSFLLFVGLLILAFIGWLVWAMVEFSPTAEKDVTKSLLASELFQYGNFAVTNQPSTCRTRGEVKGNIPADLYQALLVSNAGESGNLELHRFQKERHVLDASNSPEQWYFELGKPVMAISNVGVVDARALVCLELYASSSRGMIVTLEHSGADYWRIVGNEAAWSEVAEKPEEIPELTLPSVD